MPYWFQLRRSELADIPQMPYHFDNQILIEASPASVFDVLANSNWQNWFVDFVSVTWTSSEPYGVGSTRTVKLKSLSVQERFLAWEPGQRFSFSIDAISLPLIQAMFEDMQLESVEDGRATRLRWRVYYSPNWLMRAVHPIARAIFGRMFRQSLKNLKQYGEKVRRR